MSETYCVRIAKEHLAFSAGHFITYGRDVCERLHGHNYRVAAEVYGPLDENQLVVDFITVRDALAAIVGELDHHMLLPTEHPKIRVQAGPREIEVTFDDRRWVFPRDDCILLPIANTTSELLGRYIGRRLMADLENQTGVRPGRLRIEVDECLGQSAMVEWVDC